MVTLQYSMNNTAKICELKLKPTTKFMKLAAKKEEARRDSQK